MVVTEPFEKGTLRHVLKSSLSWAAKLNLLRDVARGMSYLHDKFMIHG
jgi:serine/threonine protein kinase